jgi:hypothetical protein
MEETFHDLYTNLSEFLIASTSTLVTEVVTALLGYFREGILVPPQSAAGSALYEAQKSVGLWAFFTLWRSEIGEVRYLIVLPTEQVTMNLFSH